MSVNWAVDQKITPVGVLAATRVADATPVLATDFNVRSYDAGSKFLLVLSAFETNTANTGGTWTVTESATDGGSYTAATTHGTLAATPASAGNSVQYVSVLPNDAKPFVLVTYTGADANTEVDITATLLVIPRGM
jgi:hypothetical protein